MENFTLKITEMVTNTITLPQYFQRNEGDFYKILNDKTYLNVVYYGNNPDRFGLYLYPKIVVFSNDLLHGIRLAEIKEITEDEFYSVYFDAKNLIEKLAEI